MASAFRLEYQKRVAAHQIEYEPDQDQVVAALDRLSNDIATRKASRGLLARRTGAPAKRRLHSGEGRPRKIDADELVLWLRR